MQLSSYDYKYPDESVAIFPPKTRGNTKLFVIYSQTGQMEITSYKNLYKYLNKEDLVVRNVSKVIKARLFPKHITKLGEHFDSMPEILLLSSEEANFDSFLRSSFKTIYRGVVLKALLRGKRSQLPIGTRLVFSKGWEAEIIGYDDEYAQLVFQSEDVQEKEYTSKFLKEFLKFLDKDGQMPIPPYLHREATKVDEERYQTIFSKESGSVAAPTASLNFTEDLEKNIAKKGINLSNITLHVGLGTFKPLQHERVEENKLHQETYFASTVAVQSLYQAFINSKRITAIGTTALRTIETIAPQVINNEKGPFEGQTQLFVYPPYQFKLVNTLLTNFHQPKSSLVVLVDAFLQSKNAKQGWREIYDFAIKNDAKLFSYGDSMLVL